MDIMELGAIGELVGGVAVIASLLFVGIQVRHGNRLAQAERMQAHVDARNREVLAPLADQAFADTFRRGLHDFEPLSHSEQLVVHSQLARITNLDQTQFILGRSGVIEGRYAAAMQTIGVGILKSPGAQQWWRTARPAYLPDDVDPVERLLAGAEARRRSTWST